MRIMRVIGRLTGLPFGPSSPGGPLGPAGPAAPGGPASPFSPLSPLGPCDGGVVVRKVIHHITTATAAFLFFPRAISQRGQKTETRSETAAKRQWTGGCNRVKGNQRRSGRVYTDLQVSGAAGIAQMGLEQYLATRKSQNYDFPSWDSMKDKNLKKLCECRRRTVTTPSLHRRC